LAILFCLCSEADAFVAANFPLFWAPASKLAFLVLGPILDLKLFMMYRSAFRPRLIWTIISVVVAQQFVYSVPVHYFCPQISVVWDEVCAGVAFFESPAGMIVLGCTVTLVVGWIVYKLGTSRNQRA